MSDAASVAATTGVPEELIARAARARAEASGATAESVLAAWGGGGSVPIAAPAPTPAETGEPAPTPDQTATPAPAVDTAPPLAEAMAPAVVPTMVGRPHRDAAPLLVGRNDNPMMALAALIALFIFGSILAVGVPGLDARSAAAEQIPGTTPVLSDAALAGREVYVQQGCLYCHTQQVRTVVTDVGLGPVTEPGTSPAAGPPTLGFVRIGPDLTHIGTRVAESPDMLRSILTDPRGVNPASLMPSYAYLSADDLSDLIQYLEESK